MYTLSRTKQLWVAHHAREIIDRDLPTAPYWKHPSDLDATQLETIVLHTTRLENRLELNASPKAFQSNQKRPVTWIQIVQAQWLLTASSDDQSSALTLWSIPVILTSPQPTPIAEVFLSGPVITGVVEVCGSSVTIALELRGR